MELRHVRYFLAVAEECSFTRAAARLRIAQSPLSRQVRQLERELDVELFTRTSRSVRLTDAGEVFYTRMRYLLDGVEHAAEAARRTARGEMGSLSVGFTASATYDLMPALVRAYHERHPGVTLAVHSEMFTQAQLRALRAGELDVGLLRPPAPGDDLVVEHLRDEPLIALLPSGHAEAAHEAVDLRALRSDMFVCCPPSPTTNVHAAVIDACARAGFEPRIGHLMSNVAAQAALVAAGLGVAIVPASVGRLGVSGVAYRPLLGPPSTVTMAVAHRARDVSPLVRGFVELSRTIVADREHLPAPSGPDAAGESGHGQRPADDDYRSVAL